MRSSSRYLRAQINLINSKILENRITLNLSVTNGINYGGAIGGSTLHIFIQDVQCACTYKLGDDEIFDKENNTVVPKFVRKADGRMYW